MAKKQTTKAADTAPTQNPINDSCFAPAGVAVAAPGEAPEPIAAKASPIQTTTSETPSAASEQQVPEEPRQWANPYRAMLTCRSQGFELGENRRFKQVVFSFADNPGPDVTARLKEIGFTYRGAEKAWTVPATAASRELALRLAQELRDQGVVAGR